MKVQGFVIYRIYYGEHLVYVGRTKQPLQNRIRGHLFAKPMHRAIEIEQVTKIEYASFQTEADMNLYEIYFILKWHPPLNVDDNARDDLTVELPPVAWKRFTTHRWENWRMQLAAKSEEFDRMLTRWVAYPQEVGVLRSAKKAGEISEDEYYDKLEVLQAEHEDLRIKLWK